MEVICVTVMLLLLLCRVEVNPVPTENFRAGDTVDLSCNKNHRDRTMWYGQKNNRAPFIIISAEMTLKHSEHPSMKFYWGYNSRINVTWNRTNNSVGLTIKNINESDEGFYFCTVGDGIFTTPGSGHILTLGVLCRVKFTPVPTENTLLRYQTTTQSIRNFRAGDTVDLSCNKNHRDRTMWYGQKSNRAPFIIISAEMTLKHSEHPSMKFYWGYNSRINVTWNRTNNSVGLTIKNINESDEGFYFCTVGDGIFTTPGSGHILTLEEMFLEQTSPANLTPTPAVLYQEIRSFDVVFAILCPALVFCLALACCLFWMWDTRSQREDAYTAVIFTEEF